MSRLVLLSIPLASACAYQPGSYASYSSSFPGARTTIGCLDVAAGFTAASPERGPVISYTIGNRCDSVTVVDFSSIRARANGVALIPFDPGNQLRPLRMEARAVITERIEYRSTSSRSDSGVCVDVAGLNGATQHELWLCHTIADRGSGTDVRVAASKGGH